MELAGNKSERVESKHQMLTCISKRKMMMYSLGVE